MHALGKDKDDGEDSDEWKNSDDEEDSNSDSDMPTEVLSSTSNFNSLGFNLGVKFKF